MQSLDYGKRVLVVGDTKTYAVDRGRYSPRDRDGASKYDVQATNGPKISPRARHNGHAPAQKQDIEGRVKSIRNRHCPTCQNHKTRGWLAARLNRQLPGHHFFITFTSPAQLRRFVRSHQRAAYGALFKAAAYALKKLARDPKFIGGDTPGFMGVLHTWGRQLEFHPHIHFVAPGGAISKDRMLWHPSRVDFYVPVEALSKIYRAHFREAMVDEGLLGEIDPDVWQIDWNVYIKPVATPGATLRYLAPYIFRVAISNSRIVSSDGGKVTFRYQRVGSDRPRTMTITAMEFIRRFLEHVLPRGFMKVRYYGFMSGNSRVERDRLSALIEIAYEFDIELPATDIDPLPVATCPSCGGTLVRYLQTLPALVNDTG